MTHFESSMPDLPHSRDNLEQAVRYAPLFFLTLLIAVPFTPLLMFTSKAPELQLLLCILATVGTSALMVWNIFIGRAMRRSFPYLKGAVGPLFLLLGLALGGVAFLGITELVFLAFTGSGTNTVGIAALLCMAGIAKPSSDLLRIALQVRRAEKIYGHDGVMQLWRYQAYQRDTAAAAWAQSPSH